MGNCKDCRHWNGQPGSPAGGCWAIKARDGALWSIPSNSACVPDSRVDDNPRLVTGPDFGCALFEAAADRAEER